jgi:hypothetical protein
LGLLFNRVDVLGPESKSGVPLEGPFAETRRSSLEGGEPTQKGKASIKDSGHLFHDQVILYGFDPLDAPGDFNGFIDGLLAIDEAAQLNNALETFDPNLE